MSAENDTPPVGEEIHLPGPTFLPVACAAGITLTVIGTTINLVISAIGLILFVVTTIMWIRDTRRDIDELPEEHQHPGALGSAYPPSRGASRRHRRGHVAVGALAGPHPHDVAHREDSDHLGAVDDHEVAEPAAHHRLSRVLERPVRRGERELRGQVIGDQLGVRDPHPRRSTAGCRAR